MLLVTFAKTRMEEMYCLLLCPVITIKSWTERKAQRKVVERKRERKIVVYFVRTLSEGTSSWEQWPNGSVTFIRQMPGAVLQHHSVITADILQVWDSSVCVCVHFLFPSLIHLNLCRRQWDVRLDVDAYLMLQMLPLLMRSPLCVTVGWVLRSSSRGLSSRATAGDSIPFWNGKRWVNPTQSCDETAIHLRLYCTSNKTFPFSVLM